MGDDGVVDEARLEDIVGRTIEAGAWAVPTMALWEALRGTLPLETVQGYEESRYMPPETVAQWSARVESVRSGDAFDAGAAERQIANRMRILEALHASGARILLGTDAPQVFSVPGFSIHREMERMVAAGMSPYEVIVSGTRSVGEYFGNEDAFGTIAEGQRAQLEREVLREGAACGHDDARRDAGLEAGHRDDHRVVAGGQRQRVLADAAGHRRRVLPGDVVGGDHLGAGNDGAGAVGHRARYRAGVLGEDRGCKSQKP